MVYRGCVYGPCWCGAEHRRGTPLPPGIFLADSPPVPDTERNAVAVAIREALKARTVPPDRFGQGGMGLTEHEIADVAINALDRFRAAEGS